MTYTKFKNAITKAPGILKSPAESIYSYIPYRIRYGSIFRNTYDFLQETQWWPADKLKEYSAMQMRRLVKHAYNTVSYYKRLFDEYGINPEQVQDFEDLKKLPVLDRETVREQTVSLISDHCNKDRLEYISTSGSTGKPLGFYIDKTTLPRIEKAFIANLWARAGFRPHTVNRTVVIRTSLLPEKLYRKKGSELLLSPYKIDDNMELYIKLIEDFDPDFIYTSPSVIRYLYLYLLDNNIELKTRRLKAMLMGSENLYDFQRVQIEKAFKCRAYSWYGHSECSVLGGECEYDSRYHIQSEYGYAELLDNEGKRIENENEIGEIVATGFNNYAMPFIRYRTGDMATLSNSKCKCGRNYPIFEKLVGRAHDFLIDSNGKPLICGLVACTVHDKLLENVSEYQYYQDTPGFVTLNIIKREEYSDKDEQRIFHDMQERMGASIKLKIEYPEKVERDPSSKFRLLVQKLDDRLEQR